jgi:hypothetical protein
MFHIVLDTFPTLKHILAHVLQLCGFMKHLKLNVSLSSIWIDLIYSMFQYLQKKRSDGILPGKQDGHKL